MGEREPPPGRTIMGTVDGRPAVKIATERVGDVILLEVTATAVDGQHVRIVQPIETAVAHRIAAMIVDTANGSDTLDHALDRILAT